jgi:hypothetical protein
MGRDSGLLHVDKLKDSLQRQVRALMMDNNIIDFLTDCVENSSLVFKDELNWIRGKSREEEEEEEPPVP